MYRLIIRALSLSLLVFGLPQASFASPAVSLLESLPQKLAKEPIEAILSLEQGKRLVLLQANTLKLYDFQQQQILKSVPLVKQGEIARAITSANGDIWIVLAERQILQYHSDLSFVKTYTLKGKGLILDASAFKNQLLLSDEKGLLLFQPDSQNLRTLNIPQLAISPKIAIVSDQEIIVELNNEQLMHFDLEKNKALRILAGHPWLVSLHVSPDGKSLVTFGEDLKMRLWDLSTGKIKNQGDVSSFLTQAVFLTDQTLFAADIDGSVYLISLPDLKLEMFENAFIGWPKRLTATDQTVLLPLDTADSETGNYLKVFSVPALHEQTQTKALFQAITAGNRELLRQALQNGIDIDYRTEQGDTLLAIAIDAKQTELALYLIEAGANLLKVNKEGHTALHHALLKSEPSKEIIDVLLAKKALGTPEQQQDYLYLAMMISDENTFTQLLDLGLDPNQRDGTDETPLMQALKEGKLKIAETLLKKGARFDILPPFENSWLMYASSNQQSLQWFLKQGLAFEINAKNSDGTSALQIAVNHGEQEACQTLLKLGADIHVEDQEGNTPLLAVFQQSLNQRSEDRQIALAQILLQQGARLDHHNHKQQGVTHFAAYSRRLKLLQFLKQFPMDWNALDSDGKTAAQLLLESPYDQDPLQVLAALEELLLLQKTDLKGQGTEGKTLLHTYFDFLLPMKSADNPTLQKRLLEVFSLMLKQGADPYQKDNEDQNALTLLNYLQEYEYISPLLAQQMRQAIRTVAQR